MNHLLPKIVVALIIPAAFLIVDVIRHFSIPDECKTLGVVPHNVIFYKCVREK